MKSISSLAVAASLLLGGVAVSAPALAQKKKNNEAAAAQPAAWAPKLSKAEAEALKPVEAAIAAKDWAAASAALAAAQPTLTSPDARYYAGQFQFQLGTNTNNAQLQEQGVDAMLASTGGDPTKVAALLHTQGALALRAQNLAKAEAAFSRLAQLNPNDRETQVALAELKFRQKKPQEALPMFERLIAAQQAAGQPVPEQWYLIALQSAVDAKMGPQAQTISRNLVSVSPNPKNWRNAMLIYRQNSTLDPATQLDTFRLMHATKGLDKSDEYLALADQLVRGRFYAEARDVLDAGIAAGKVNRSSPDVAPMLSEISNKSAQDRAALGELEARARSAANGDLPLRLAEGYFGHKDYAKAAEFYRLALQKGGVDANLVNTRLGMALAHSGQNAEAVNAFKAVTGPRADLASYWMLWLNQRG